MDQAVVGGFALRWGTSSHGGNVRAANEDTVLALPGLFVVADGMGGYTRGDVASAIVVEQFRDAVTTAGDAVLRIGEVAAVLSAANDAILRRAGDGGPIGTTVVGLAIAAGDDGTVPVVFHAGDSRCYLLVAGELRQVTTDHSEVQELVDAGLLDADAARVHPHRNVITRSLGYDQTVAAEFCVLEAVPMRLLLCSDGLTNELDDDLLGDELNWRAAPGEAATRLVQRALAGEGRDNISAIVVDVMPVAAPAPDDLDITAPRDTTRAGWAPRGAP